MSCGLICKITFSYIKWFYRFKCNMFKYNNNLQNFTKLQTFIITCTFIILETNIQIMLKCNYNILVRVYVGSSLIGSYFLIKQFNSPGI